jgi:hypothetical protein
LFEIEGDRYFKQQIYFPLGKALRLVAQLIWNQGIQMKDIRRQFWRQLWIIARTKPRFLSLYLGLCAAGEHFWEYRVLARERITAQLGYDPLLAHKEKQLVAN